ncbi:MAG: tannase/feruloyl esterase family alpha/beta hydrolase [Saprospiraceae bacterium]|nr:tannase/feruloyl esterase family alpha/beta hydrolase [Saprospiraceae bacterium]
MKILTLTPLLILCIFISLQAQQSDPLQIDRKRAKIMESYIPDVIVQSTALIEASDGNPRHILVRGYTMPSNYFLMRFPVDAWNEKIFMDGCGLGCGTLPTDISGKLKKALQRGYATATTNSGHWGTSIRDFTWAHNNRQAEIDFAHRAVHETLRATTELVKAFYNRDPALSYFWSCSNGGRQAVMTAALYPGDFDGVISEAPVLDWSKLMILYAWLRQTNTGPDRKDIITRKDLALVSQLLYQECDKLDGKADGLIDDPSRCSFDLNSLRCQDGPDCLSPEKVEVLKKWYRGPENSKGEKVLAHGIALSSEPYWGWLLGATDEAFDEFPPWDEFMQYITFQTDPGEHYSVYDFNFDEDPKKMTFMSDLLDASHQSIQSYKDGGGKILMFHGIADPLVPYQYSIDYFHRINDLYGQETDDFFRLFLIPGMDHCSYQTQLGISDQSVDPLSALETWVEKDRAPDQLPVIQYLDDGSIKSRFSVSSYRDP